MTEISPSVEQRKPRTWLSIIDWLIGFISPLFLALMLSFPLVIISSDLSLDDLNEALSGSSGNGIQIPIQSTLLSGLLQQLLAVAGAIWVARKGFGPFKDWKLGVKLQDVGIGLLAFPIVFGLALGTQQIMQALLSIDDEVSNTNILSDAMNSGWIILAVVLAVVVAPISEEIVFRGMTLRIFEGIGGRLFNNGIAARLLAVVVSTSIFALLHSADDPSINAQLVVWATIFVLGACLAVMTFYFDRLGPAILTHGYFNLFAVIGVLFVDAA